MPYLISATSRTKYAIAIAATLLPVVAFMLVFFLTSFQPVFQSMEKVVQTGYQEVRPLHELEVALLGAAMPPHDYLIHGAEAERWQWGHSKELVAVAFQAAVAGSRSPQDRELLLALRTDWTEAALQGDALFRMRPGACRDDGAGTAIESFDASLDRISQGLRSLIGGMEEELHSEYLRVAKRKTQGLALAFATVLLSLLSGVVGSIWMTRTRRTILDQSLRDPLTGVLNRRALDNELSRMQSLVLGAEEPVWYSLLLLDLDLFKSVNDRYGHDVGDLALKAVVRTTARAIRSKDIFSRYGGEEFLLLLPDTRLDEARTLAERIRRRIESSPIQISDDAGPIRMTVSIGCASNAGKVVEVAEVLRQADQAMYKAKRAGRNRVVCHD